MKVPGILRDIAAVIAIIILISTAGWICSESNIMGNNPPVTTKFFYQVLVIDENGTLVPNQTVYAIACLQEPAGWTTPTRYTDNVSLSGITNDAGFAEIISGNFSLSKGGIVWLGASTNKSILESDLNGKAFNPGNVGKWARYNYSDIQYNTGMNITGYSRFIVVRDSDGRMIDVAQFNQEIRMYFPPNQLIDAFTYMDNRSWAYPL